MLYRAAIVLVGAVCGGYNSVASSKSEGVREERERRECKMETELAENQRQEGRGRD